MAWIEAPAQYAKAAGNSDSPRPVGHRAGARLYQLGREFYEGIVESHDAAQRS
jgi:hypothetical protein